jgi:hypothetical protein
MTHLQKWPPPQPSAYNETETEVFLYNKNYELLSSKRERIPTEAKI